MNLHELHERVAEYERRRTRGRKMERMEPIYDKDGSLLYYESEFPKATAEGGSATPFHGGTVFEDSDPTDAPDIPRQPVTRPEW